MALESPLYERYETLNINRDESGKAAFNAQIRLCKEDAKLSLYFKFEYGMVAAWSHLHKQSLSSCNSSASIGDRSYAQECELN